MLAVLARRLGFARLLEARDLPLERPGEGTRDRVGRRQRPRPDDRLGLIPYPNPEERGGQGHLGGRSVELHGVGPVAVHGDVQEEVGAGLGRQAGDQVVLVGDAGDVHADVLEARGADALAVDVGTDGPVVEGDERHLVPPLSLDIDEFRGPADAPGHRTGPADRGFVEAADGEVVNAGGGDLVVPRQARHVDHADPVAVVGEIGSREPRRHARPDGAEFGVGLVGREDRHEPAVRWCAGQLAQVVGAVDRGRSGGVVVARQDDGAYARLDELPEPRRDPFDRGARLDRGLEQVAGDQHEVDRSGDRQLDRSLEGEELALALVAGTFAEGQVSGTEMDVGRLEDTEHLRMRPPRRGNQVGAQPSRAERPAMARRQTATRRFRCPRRRLPARVSGRIVTGSPRDGQGRSVPGSSAAPIPLTARFRGRCYRPVNITGAPRNRHLEDRHLGRAAPGLPRPTACSRRPSACPGAPRSR